MQATAGSVELHDSLVVIRRQLVLLVAVALLGGASRRVLVPAHPIHESTASVLVRAMTPNAFDPGQRVDQQLNMVNQRQIAQSQPVAALAAKTLGTAATPEQLLEHVDVDVPANSQVLRIHYRDTGPLSAQRGADAFAKAYLDFRRSDAELQAKTSRAGLQRDLIKLTKELSQAQKTAADTDASATTRGAAARKAQSLNNRSENLQTQLLAFTGFDFTRRRDRPRRPDRPAGRAAQLAVGQLREPALHQVQPRAVGRDEPARSAVGGGDRCRCATEREVASSPPGVPGGAAHLPACLGQRPTGGQRATVVPASGHN
jgi:uncharacterized protein involved in exopolysaccharide biosynthesis